jgi:hypothetical protein
VNLDGYAGVTWFGRFEARHSGRDSQTDGDEQQRYGSSKLLFPVIP